MGRKKHRGAPRIVSILLLFASACAWIVAFGPSMVYAQGPAEKFRLKIMPLGDSITFGTPDPGYGGYRHLLGTLLSNDGYNVEFVGSGESGNGAIPSPNNEGHPGWTIPEIKKGLDSKGWLETYQPDIVLLHIGTNDLRPRVGAAASAPGNLSALLDDILARLPQAHVIVAQIIPFRRGPDQDHQSYSAAIPDIVASKGPRVSMVDMHNILFPSDYADGFHPNASGYDKMARAWERALRAVIPGFTERDATLAPQSQSASTVAAVPQVKPAHGAPRQIRQPRGIYGVVLAQRPYIDTIDNPAISGLYLYFQWTTLEPKKGQFD